jgi:hypothetical protein
MQYDPLSPGSRQHLATCILDVLQTADFIEEWHDDTGDIVKERVFYRPVTMSDGTVVEGVRVLVYTSIVGDEVRDVGKDAIRVTAVYRSRRTGLERGIIKETRIHRVGDTDAICDRLLKRMRKVFGKARRPNRCSRCGAPMFTSKNGNDVCCDFCWKSDAQMTEDQRQQEIRQAEKNARYQRWGRGFRGRRWAY